METQGLAAAREREERLFRDGKPMEHILKDLRAEGFSVVDSMLVVSALTGCSLRDAKIAVHNSEAWADLREAHDSFHEELEARVVEEFGGSADRKP